MSTFLLTTTFYKNYLYSNFFDINHKWLFEINSSFNQNLIILESSVKNYNQKKFIISLMLVEYLLKGPSLNNKLSLIFSKFFYIKRKISLGYWLKNSNLFIFLDTFITDIYWTMNVSTKILKNINEMDLKKSINIKYTVHKLLELTYLIKNKIKFERYLLKKKYTLKICFFGYNYLYYIWWTKIISFPTIKY